jgi:tRNA A37 threonylcarbamoyladenosine dehydratase
MWYERTEALIGKENIEKLKNSHVAVFGVGGVGSFVIEALARAGIGEITVIDGDVVCESNINRQLIATADVIGQPKVNVMQKRILSINPDIEVNAIYEFYTPDKRDEFLKGSYTYVVDAIDSVPNKIDLIKSLFNSYQS